MKIRRQKINKEKGDDTEENTSFSKVNLATIYHKAMTDGDVRQPFLFRSSVFKLIILAQ